MMTAIREWPDYLAEIFRVTAPGGHIQLTEMSINFTSQTGTLRNDSGLKVVERVLQKYAYFNHFDFQIGSKLSTLVEGAGFHSVDESVIEIPVGAWQSGQSIP
jgi:ubiquinone/menaquinone biosynthesis C-methylase UbiE